MKRNLVGWFEIPVTKMDRAVKFYNTVFNIEIEKQDFGGALMAWFPISEDAYGAPGALIQHEAYEPSDSKGVLIYFHSDNITTELDKVEAAGGQIIQQKTLISNEAGFIAIFIDCEGNRIALHANA